MVSSTALIIPDCHIPFEDKKAYATMLKIAQTQKITHIYLLGDFLDMYGLSEYDKNPDLGDTAELYCQEIIEGNARLDELSDLFPKAGKIFLEGNHEIRLSRFIYKNAAVLRKTITLPTQLKLDTRKDWSYIPFTNRQRVQVMETSLWARHCPYSSGTPYANAIKAGDSFIYGHTHQVAYDSFTTKLSGKKITAINGGWLGDETQPVFDYVKNQPDWQQAFTFVFAMGSAWDFELVKIGSDVTKYHGNFY